MSFDALWTELDAIRVQKHISYRRLAAQINGIDHRRRMSPSTVHDRMTHHRRVDWPEMRLVITALELAEEPWRHRWTRAEKQWRSASDPVEPVEQGKAYLPCDISEFIGRESEVAALVRWHSSAERGGTAVSISTIEGMAGVGKTRFAVHVAHRLRRRFDEIQLYVDLRGNCDELQPIEPSVALETLLHLLGVPAAQIPAAPEARAALYRDRLDGRRAIVVLDDAAGAEQVRPLLPGSPTCHVLITSRRTLAIDGADAIRLDVFSPEEAVALLRRILGDERVDGEPEAAAEIAQLCGYLPLAIAVAARRLRNRIEWRLADLAERLRDDDGTRVEELRFCDRTVRRVFDVSYENLTPPARRLFRRIGMHPGVDVTVASAAILLDASVQTADGLLERLLEDHMIQEVSPGRYQLHDLLLSYARWRADTDEPDGCRAETVHRVLRWYLLCADSADRWLAPHRRHVDPDRRLAPSGVLGFAGYHEALAWCEAERPNLVRAAAAAAGYGLDGLDGLDTIAWQLPQALYSFFCLRKHWDDWLATFRIALAATQRLADPAAEAWVLDGLGIALAELGRLPEAIDSFDRALILRRRLGDLAGVADVLNNLGEAYRMDHRFTEAIECYRQDLMICRVAGHRYGEAVSLNNIGKVEHALGRLTEAMESQWGALVASREIGERYTEGEALNDLASVYLTRGDLAAAQAHFRRALDIRRSIGDRLGAARTQAGLGDALNALSSAEATAHWHQAMVVLAELDDPQVEELSGKLLRHS